MAFSLDDRTVKLWDAGSGALQQTFDGGAMVVTLSFSDDGTSLQTDRGLLPILPLVQLFLKTQLPSSVFVTD